MTVEWPTILSLLLALLGGSLGFTAYAFTTFETHESAQVTRESIERRLERIEAKLDRLTERAR
jgi:hypothetical protein